MLDALHFVLNDATVMGDAAPRIAMPTFLKQTRLSPYFCATSHAVSGSRRPLKTWDQMGQKGPLG